jgi:hypothetical protein
MMVVSSVHTDLDNAIKASTMCSLSPCCFGKKSWVQDPTADSTHSPPPPHLCAQALLSWRKRHSHGVRNDPDYYSVRAKQRRRRSFDDLWGWLCCPLIFSILPSASSPLLPAQHAIVPDCLERTYTTRHSMNPFHRPRGII